MQHFGSPDTMCEGNRYPELRENLEHADLEGFRSFMFFVNIFLRPHLWFRPHFAPVVGVGLEDLADMGDSTLRRGEDWGTIYLIRYEKLSEPFPLVMKDLGFSTR